MFPKINRLSHEEIVLVNKTGYLLHRGLLRVKYIKSTTGLSQFAVIIPSSATKSAVLRNFLKRVVREKVRKSVSKYRFALFAVIYINRLGKFANKNEIRQEILYNWDEILKLL